MDFTVILKRPASIADDEFDIYIAFVRDQDSLTEAVKSAQMEVLKVDQKYHGNIGIGYEDYSLLAMIYGIQRIALFGWQYRGGRK